MTKTHEPRDFASQAIFLLALTGVGTKPSFTLTGFASDKSVSGGNGVSTFGSVCFAVSLMVMPATFGSMPFCVELDNLKDTDAPIHQPAAMLVAAD